MKESPLPFTADMIKAVYADLKTKTRRVIKPQFTQLWGQGVRIGDDTYSCHVNIPVPDGWKWLRCPYGKAGDRLWVREACAIGWCDTSPLAVDYHADGKRTHFVIETPQQAQAAAAYINDSRRPPMYMPRWASRLMLEVVSVGVERVQDITQEDAVAEGCVEIAGRSWGRLGFSQLWDQINGTRGYGWDVNPWVWVVEFRRLPQPERNVQG